MHNKERVLSIVELANGERVGMAAVEITTVPHMRVLCIIRQVAPV